MKLPFVLLCTAIYAVSALPVETESHVLHERELGHNGLRRDRRVDGDSVMPFRIALKQSNLERGYDYLMNVSHPRSSHYGKLWTSDQVNEAFAPSEASVDTVRAWLLRSDIRDITHSRGTLEFHTTVSHAESLFMSQYYEYTDDRRGTVRVGCQQYHMPRHISEHVDYISPGVALSAPMEKRSVSRQDFGHRSHVSARALSPSRQKLEKKSVAASNTSSSADLSNCGERMTPDCIRALYGIPDPSEVASNYQSDPANTVGLFEYFGIYNQTDINKFFSKYASNVPQGTHPKYDSIVPQSRFDNRTFPGKSIIAAESNIDLDLLYSFLYPQTVTLYQYWSSLRAAQNGIGHFGDAIENFLENLDASYCPQNETNPDRRCGVFTASRVTSISYGAGEIFFPKAYQERQCNEFMKLALQGHTFTVASGDWGVESQPFSYTNGGTGCIVAGNYTASTGGGLGATGNGTVFSPGYPQNCPYVLSVGGTQLQANETVNDAECAMQVKEYNYPSIAKFSSSGGFSNYFERPSYQSSAVDSYFSKYDPGYAYYTFNGVDGAQSGTNIGANGGRYNRAGRAFLDVSANGANLEYYLSSLHQQTAGTSLSAPIWASILTLINEKRSEAGKSPVGFVNPVLYEHPEVFKDITNGNNPGCGTQGFSAVPGWDPITGLGTPNYAKVLDLFLSLP